MKFVARKVAQKVQPECEFVGGQDGSAAGGQGSARVKFVAERFNHSVSLLVGMMVRERLL